MLRREWCLVTKRGTVINMSLTARQDGPVLTDYQVEQGYSWLPIELVKQSSLNNYQYWDARP